MPQDHIPENNIYAQEAIAFKKRVQKTHSKIQELETCLDASICNQLSWYQATLKTEQDRNWTEIDA